MSGWRSGDILAGAAGLVLLASAAAPWVRTAAGSLGYAIAPGRESLFGFTVLAGVSLLVSGVLRTSWTALVALLAAFIGAFVGFTAGVIVHAPGVHAGFGLFALAAGTALSMAACVFNAIEREGRAL